MYKQRQIAKVISNIKQITVGYLCTNSYAIAEMQNHHIRGKIVSVHKPFILKWQLISFTLVSMSKAIASLDRPYTEDDRVSRTYH